MQTLPSSSCSSSLPRAALLIVMNLKNFPKSLDSKTSCLRITIPENLDLALEGLIRKVLREQPKIDEIYAFAADYFDTLLKIRDKIGTKFAADQLCPFHNDEDAHEMIKLASVFAKPESSKTKMPKINKTKNSDSKAGRKKPSEPRAESKKPVRNIKQTVEIQKKLERLTGDKKPRKLHETKPHEKEQNQLKLEPKTEDVGDDEEFLKSDSIKLLVEKELMEAAQPRPEDKSKKKKNETNTQLNEQLDEPTEKEELCTVIDSDHIKADGKKTGAIVNEEENQKMENDAKYEKKDVKTEEENKVVDKTEAETHNTVEEEITQALNSANSASAEERNKELRNDSKTKNEEAVVVEIQDETKNENNRAKSIENSAAEEKTQKLAANETKAEAIIEDMTHTEISREPPKEIAEGQNVAERIVELDPGKEERAVQEETQDAVKIEEAKESPLAEEANPSPDEMCTVVDILSIKPHERNEQVKEDRAVEPKLNKEEGINEAKIKTEKVLINEDEEGAQTEKSKEAFEKVTDTTFAKEAKEVAISSNEKKAKEEYEKFTPERVKIADEPLDSANSGEKLKTQVNSEDDESVARTSMGEKEVKKIVSEDTEPVLPEDQKSTENNLQGDETVQTSKIIKNDLLPEENTIKEITKTAIENENGKGVEEQFRFKENPVEIYENDEPLIMPEKAEVAKGSETQSENECNVSEESSKVEGEAMQQVKTEIEAEKLIQDYEKTEDKLEEVKSVTHNQKSSEDRTVIKDERTNVKELIGQPEVEKLEPKEKMESIKEVEGEVEVPEEESTCEKPKDDATGFPEKTDVAENTKHTFVTLPKDSEKEKLLNKDEIIKTSDESEKAETEIDSVESENPLGNKIAENRSEDMNTTKPGDDLSTVVDSHHVIKIEEAEKVSEENPHAGVQIKTIQTHYYDTLQVPAQLIKEYKVHPVKNDSAIDDLLNKTNVDLSSDKGESTETSAPPLDIPRQGDEELYKRDLEDSLMTPSSNSSLNVSELSIQTISEIFLNNEKEHSAREVERRYFHETGNECNESHVAKQEVEEIIHKTIMLPLVGATPVAPRDDVEVNEEPNIENSLKAEKEQEPSVDSDERANHSNGGRSLDSDTPVISVEVKTVIETPNLEDEEQERDGGGIESDVQIRIETTIDVPEGVIVDVREEKEYKDEVRQHASNDPPTSETVPKDSQTSSGESESTISSTATEIKRNDSAKRHFSSTRALITTQSLDLDNRNPLLKTRSLSSFRQGVIDFEVWNAIEKELEEAATKIQSNFRGYKTRKKLQRENAVHITTEESSCSTTPVEPEPREELQQSTGEFHDSIVLSEHPR